MLSLINHGSTLYLSPPAKNRDNILSSVLHFLCVLIKDAELKEYLNDYMVDVFTIAISTINSKEWTVR